MKDLFQPKKLKHLLTGITRVKSILLNLHQGHASTVLRIYKTFLVAIILLNQKGKLHTVELVRKSKKTILKDKKIFSDLNSLILSWSKISRQELTENEKVLKPFWNKQCLEASKRLWLPIETDCAGSASNLSSGSLKSMELNSLCSIEKIQNPQTKNSQMTYCPSYMCTPVDEWVEEDIRCRKIRVYPNAKQKKMLRQWIGTSRYVYNRALRDTKENNDQMNFQKLRNKFVTANYKPKDGVPSQPNLNIQEWELDTPKDIRAGAVEDVVKAFKTAMSNLRNNNINKFNLQYRTKKKESSIVIPASGIKMVNDKLFIYKTYCRDYIKTSKDKSLIGITFDHDCRLKNDNGKWYLYIPYKAKSNKTTPKKEICALDPGSRKFQTLYSEDVAIKIGINKDRLKKLQSRIDLLQSLRGRNMIRKCHFKQKMNKAQFRMKSLVDELHYQTISYLTKSFKMIFIPKFESQELVRINKSKKFRRDILSLQHYTFRERLIAKSKLQKNCCVEVCTEEFTSKTCTNCGKINYVGSSEVYHCNSCNLTIDRDINGARNIFIKHLNQRINNL
jgi:putative transposase